MIYDFYAYEKNNKSWLVIIQIVITAFSNLIIHINLLNLTLCLFPILSYFFFLHVCLKCIVVSYVFKSNKDIQCGAIIVLDFREVKWFIIGISIHVISFACWLYNAIRLINNEYSFKGSWRFLTLISSKSHKLNEWNLWE